MKKVIFAIFAAGALGASGAEYLTSPDGRLRAEVWTNDSGTPMYSLTFDGDTVVRPSRLGLLGDRYDFDRWFDIASTERSSADTVWRPVWGEFAEVRDNHNELAVLLREDMSRRTGNEVVAEKVPKEFVIRFRLFNDGLGFRYEFPNQGGWPYLRVKKELTEFNLPESPMMYCIPGDNNTDEYLWTIAPMDSLETAFRAYGNHTESNRLPELSVQTPLLMKMRTGRKDVKPLYVNIHEADLRDYGVLNLAVDTVANSLTSRVIEDKMGYVAYFELPFHTPWRTVMVADNAPGILASQLVYNLNEPCAIGDTSWIKPQKYVGVWWEMFLGDGRTWAYSDSITARPGTDYTRVKPNGRHAANAANVRRYIDFAAENGIPGVLVEGWNEGWEDWTSYRKNRHFDFTKAYPDFPVDSLTAYAASRGVKLIMHHETGANAADYDFQMDSAFRFMNRHGYEAVKTGYVGELIPRSENHGSQWFVDHVLRVAKKAADYHIMVDSHEAPRPTGLGRTYPNWMAQESARGTEFEAMQGNPPYHTTVLPFTRLKGGPMDFTPGIFRMDITSFAPGYQGKKKRATISNQLALYLTMYSPVQMAGDLPEHYERHIDAFQFIKDVPVDWSRSVYLDAEPGDFIVVARKDRNSSDWYVGGVTNEDAREYILGFGFLPEGEVYECTVYRDASDSDGFTNPERYEIFNTRVTSASELPLRMARAGGFAVRLHQK